MIPQGSRDWLTTGEAAEVLGMNRATIQDWFDFGYLGGVALPSGYRRISKSSVEEMRVKLAEQK